MMDLTFEPGITDPQNNDPRAHVLSKIPLCVLFQIGEVGNTKKRKGY